MRKFLQAGAFALGVLGATPVLADSGTQTYKDTCVITDEVRDGVRIITEDTADICGQQILETPVDEEKLAQRLSDFGIEIQVVLDEHDRLLEALERFNNRNKDTK